MTTNNDALDAYLKENENRIKPKKERSFRLPKINKGHSITTFRKWQACAAMDIVLLSTILMMILIAAGITMTIDSSYATYVFYAAAVFFIIGAIYLAADYYRFSTWHKKLAFNLEGMSVLMNGLSYTYWSHSGEHWIPVRLHVTMNEHSDPKHFKVMEIFLQKLRKRLDQWTVSKEKQIGYSQPNGWRYGELTLTGDMNPRVLNLIRKRFSGELHRLAKLMPGSIVKVKIESQGQEKHHKVNHDID